MRRDDWRKAPDLPLEIDVHAIRGATEMIQAEISAAFEFSLRSLQQ